MYPMDYEEFRWALGDTATIPLLRSVWEHPQPLKEVHRKLMRDFRLYMLVGGMPQAVDAYIESNNFEVDFLLSRGTKITPIEVKSSSYKTHVSLDAFCSLYCADEVTLSREPLSS